MSGPERRLQLEAIYWEALAAADAGAAVGRCVGGDARRLRIAGSGLAAGTGVAVLAVGKAAVPMAAAFAERAGAALRTGLVVHPRGGPAQAIPRVRMLEAAHPVPDESSERAAGEARRFVAGLGAGDVLCVLLSGGASSLLAGPAEGVALGDLSETTRLLLEAGADIEELNCVRKHLSSVAGGRLGRASRAGRIELLVVSDVAGDRLDVIGSGPFTGDPSGYGDALAVLDTRGLRRAVPAAVRAHLEAGARGEREETPAPGDAALARVRATVLASNRTALEAALAAGRREGLATRLVSPPLAGEARDAGRWLAGLARRAGTGGPLLLVAGGETVVRVRGRGRGGRSQELALAAAIGLAGEPRVALLAAGSDGADGPTPAAGAHADGGTVERGRAAGVDAARALEDNDSHGFFCAEGGLFVTGPTRTNVRDLALVRVDRAL